MLCLTSHRDEADAVTGHTLMVDGGLTLQWGGTRSRVEVPLDPIRATSASVRGGNIDLQTRISRIAWPARETPLENVIELALRAETQP
ncbi:MAG: hypothetical protein PGN25_14180 [Methylorubrum populi]